MVSACSPAPIERWKLDLVRARAVRFGFRGADLDDVQQEVLVEVLLFRYQPDLANETTALVSLIDRRLCMAWRRQQRYRHRMDRMQQWVDPTTAEVDAEQTQHEERTGRHLDVQELIARLTPEDRALCDALIAGQTIDFIAKRLQCSWHTVNRRIQQLRKHLTEMGVDGYVQ